MPDPAVRSSARRSETVRWRCADVLALLELTVRLGQPPRLGLGIGSVGRYGSVGPSETCALSSVSPRRAAPSVLLKIRVSMVRFRPWPPLLTQ